jgi:hypothetical protein
VCVCVCVYVCACVCVCAQVLRVLRTKDESIATLNGKVGGLEGVLEETRRSLAASNRALQEKEKEVDRLWREQVLTAFTSPRAAA